MSYKTILVHVDESNHLDARVRIAANIAMAENAHLIGTAVTGISRFVHEAVTVNPEDPVTQSYLRMLRKRADSALNGFETPCKDDGHLLIREASDR